MSHHHEGGHDHDHGDGHSLSFPEKMVKLLEHWIKHNTDHAESYRDWAEKAKANGLEGAIGPLEDAAGMTLAISGKFEEAIEALKK